MKTSKKTKNIRKNIFLICGVTLMLLATGCSKNSLLNPAGNCFGGNWATGYVDELQEWSEAIAAYSENPTAENCAKYKSAAKSYLDALDNIYDCIPTADRAEFDKEIKEAKADIDSEGCN